MIRRIALAVSAVALLVALIGIAWAADTPAAPAKKVNILLITGGHAFDQKQFFAMFDAFPGIAYKHVEEKVGGEAFENIDDFKYDVIVIYNFNRKISDKQAANFIKLLDKGVGLVVLHHAIAAYNDWPEYRKILGARYYLKDETDADGTVHKRCLWKHDVDLKEHVSDPKSPVAAGVTDFEIHDESYKGYTVDPQVKVFLTTDEPTSNKEIGWTNTYRKANVCYLELGHDAKAYENKKLQTLYTQAIKWAAGGAK
ncbi:MAG: ThuA domain-containing protein [Planctomycetota bacterium]|nr:ThuA domain-containing protein [Planctomycetota bacterium]